MRWLTDWTRAARYSPQGFLDSGILIHTAFLAMRLLVRIIPGETRRLPEQNFIQQFDAVAEFPSESDDPESGESAKWRRMTSMKSSPR